MKMDLWWFVMLLVVFGIMWWQGSGPNQPESTAGPFIRSPLADSSSGAGANGYQIRQNQTGLTPAAGPTDSNYAGQVKIYLGNARYEIQPNQEYIVLEAAYNNKEAVNISGWQLVNGAFRRPRPAVVKIPFGVKLFIGGQANPPAEPIILEPGAQAVILTGRMSNADPFPINVSFRINKCSGYLARLPNYRFHPYLSTNCPNPRQETGLVVLDNACLDFVTSLSSCHTPRFEWRSDGYPYVDGQIDRLSSQCRTFLQSHFNYNGCVVWHSQDQDFWQKDWRVFLNQTGELWAERFDRVLLYDQFGKLVDEVTYQD